MDEVKIETKRKPTNYLLVIIGLIIVLAFICGLVAFFIFFRPAHQTPLGWVPPSPPTHNTSWCTADDCPAGTYCSGFGACLAHVCRDGICSPEERLNGSCPIDCGCPKGLILNAHINQCQQGVNVSSDTVNKIINNYLIQHNITGTVTDIHDTYYGNQTVKSVFIDCREPMRTTMSCGIVLFIDNNGTIIEVVRTT